MFDESLLLGKLQQAFILLMFIALPAGATTVDQNQVHQSQERTRVVVDQNQVHQSQEKTRVVVDQNRVHQSQERTQVLVDQVRVHQSPERTRVVFELSNPVKHNLFFLTDPRRLVIDFESAVLNTDLEAVDLKQSPILKIRSGLKDGSDLRMVFDLAGVVRPSSFSLEPVRQYGDRLVVDLHIPESRKQVQEDPAGHELRDVIIAIDAGHGGDDPGATGYAGIYEKDVVLSIATLLNNLFQKMPGYRAVMIRNGDYYIELRRRTQIARENHADVFLSIHANAFRSSSVNGVSVFALSDQGATSETARILAEKENETDLIGGVSLGDKDEMLPNVLLDLTSAASLEIGEKILGQISRFNNLHKTRVEQASFVVLKSPEIPSLLIETGFISNPEEGKKLATRQHQQRIANGIFEGVRQYMEDSPPQGTFLAWKKEAENDKLITYVIEPGDSLIDIANKYHISFENLIKFNGLRSNTILIGQVLKIPAS